MNLLSRFNTILITISSKMDINIEAYEAYAEETRKLFVDLYSFYPLSPSVHKMLVHGATIIKHCLLPIGMMSEEVQERRNKCIRRFRENHSRKFNRLVNIEDVFKRLMITSDPFIMMNGARKIWQRDDLPEAVQNLLILS